MEMEKTRIQIRTVLEVPSKGASEEQIKEWLMLQLGWNGFPDDLDDGHPLKHCKLVAENPDSTEITILD